MVLAIILKFSYTVEHFETKIGTSEMQSLIIKVKVKKVRGLANKKAKKLTETR